MTKWIKLQSSVGSRAAETEEEKKEKEEEEEERGDGGDKSLKKSGENGSIEGVYQSLSLCLKFIPSIAATTLQSTVLVFMQSSANWLHRIITFYSSKDDE